MNFPDSAFWDFSIHIYALPQVEQSCLALQNQHQLDVNLMLLALWLSYEKQTFLETNQWQQLVSVALPWQEMIKPLRKSRLLIKNSSIAWPSDFQTETRQSLAKIEISAEHMQQLALEKVCESFQTEHSCADLTTLFSDNVTHYLEAINTGIELSSITSEMKVLIQAIEHNQENTKTITP